MAGEQLPWQENSDSGRRLEVGRSAMVKVGEKWLSQEAVLWQDSSDCGKIAVLWVAGKQWLWQVISVVAGKQWLWQDSGGRGRRTEVLTHQVPTGRFRPPKT